LPDRRKPPASEPERWKASTVLSIGSPETIQAQDRRRPADGDIANRRGRGAGRAPEPLCRTRPGRAGVPGRTGAAQSAAATSPAESGFRPPERPGSRGYASMTCATPQRPSRLLRRQHPGADGADGALLVGRCSSLPARHAWPGRCHRGRSGRAGPGRIGQTEDTVAARSGTRVARSGQRSRKGKRR
jgi:hypothetical protein